MYVRAGDALGYLATLGMLWDVSASWGSASASGICIIYFLSYDDNDTEYNSHMLGDDNNDHVSMFLSAA